MKIWLEARVGRPGVKEFTERLTGAVVDNGGSVATDPQEPVDMVIAAGGDGTMLAAVRVALGWDVPVLGFNLGTLGFLTEGEPDRVEETVRRLNAGDFEISTRTTVEATIGGVSALGVNDVVVEKIDSTRIVELEVQIDGAPFTTYRSDGLIVATPTGSTAYSFSAGGPLVAPEVPALVVTPVASHALFDRSVVLHESARLEVTVKRDRQVRVNVDKCDMGELREGETVSIGAGAVKSRFVRLDERTFPSLLHEKFGLD